MEKDIIIQKLKECGCRITKQRLVLLDVILEGECTSCKEIYYKASKLDENIGTATVYRMINTLEEIGAIDRKNMYRICCKEPCDMKEACTCTIELEDDTRYHLSAGKWNRVLEEGLRACGYQADHKIKSVTVDPSASDHKLRY
ncbi:MAG: transcriptional repressor, partial [Lachnospiraceae bacterium]|nr:transcriptional repressor [Lachnospiraceae bacterium]